MKILAFLFMITAAGEEKKFFSTPMPMEVCTKKADLLNARMKQVNRKVTYKCKPQ